MCALDLWYFKTWTTDGIFTDLNYRLNGTQAVLLLRWGLRKTERYRSYFLSICRINRQEIISAIDDINHRAGESPVRKAVRGRLPGSPAPGFLEGDCSLKCVRTETHDFPRRRNRAFGVVVAAEQLPVINGKGYGLGSKESLPLPDLLHLFFR
ncbi:hypothetical protein L083_1322 [Actinoplanes sp. N902-109]|nr:hypothetical protein L083_1322 [Actinoplanes sp. N902-109]